VRSSADADGAALGFFVGFFVGFFDGAEPSDAPSLLLLAADETLTGAAVGLPICDANKKHIGTSVKTTDPLGLSL
jgi:hypothetical protein